MYGIELSRISKLFLDRDQSTAQDALARRQSFGVVLECGEDVARSYTLQVAALTAASIAVRCFPGAVRVSLAPGTLDAPLLVWPALHLTIGRALAEIVGAGAVAEASGGCERGQRVVFGDAAVRGPALRATFDGWIAKVGPAHEIERLSEREYCSVTGVLMGALAMSELFLLFAEITPEACRRVIALSLWRPDLDPGDPAALGIPVEALPGALWALGLGHLGNAYLWTLGTLPYVDPTVIELFLNDFDKVEPENVETGLIFNAGNVPNRKTRACAEWLERRQFGTRLIERRFDETFRCRDDEPRLVLCGFDSNPARRDLTTAKFLRVAESGLGGNVGNFDTISFHTLPNPRDVTELWPDLSAEEKRKRSEHQDRVARENAGYRGLGRDKCGRYELAGKAVAVPFVGAGAASLVIAETLRLLHGGSAYSDIRLALGAPRKRVAQRIGDYGIDDLAGIAFAPAKKLSER
jgi:hypothetical protein